MRSFSAPAGALLLALLLAACAGAPKISGSGRPDTDISGYATWAWVGVPEDVAGDARVYNRDVDQGLQRVVGREMAARGYRSAPPEQADLLIHYHAGLGRSLDTGTMDAAYGYSSGWTYGAGVGGGYGWTADTRGTYVRKYEKGTLVLDVADRTANILIWRGTAHGKVLTTATREDREARLGDAVRGMLQGFPPAR